MANFRMSPKYEREMDTNFENQQEAFKLLDLIDAEFRSDPMSTQCFDLRIVQRVHECIAKRKIFVERHPIFKD